MFGDDEATFTKVCNGVMEQVVHRGADECFFGSYPTMAAINKAYHKDMSKAILMAQLTDLSEYCGCKNKLDDRQLEQCAEIIGMTYPHLKISELALFFVWFKTAKYGKFYGSVDPLVITSALRSFVRDRNDAYFKRDSELNFQKIEEAKKGCISWEEYCKRTGTIGKCNPLK